MKDYPLEAQTMPANIRTTFMTMAAILSLTSLDAEAANDYRLRHGLPGTGVTVADILPDKQRDLDAYPERYEPVARSMRERGQAAPIGVRDGYLIDGLHRVALAVRAGWAGMSVTGDILCTSDAVWDEANPGIAWT